MRRRYLYSLVHSILVVATQAQAEPNTSAISTISNSNDSASTTDHTRLHRNSEVNFLDDETSYRDIWYDLKKLDECYSFNDPTVDDDPNNITVATEPSAKSPTSSVPEATETPEPFISFEDWKKIKQAEEDEREYQEEDEQASKPTENEESNTSSEVPHPPTDVTSGQSNSNDSSNTFSSAASSSPKSKGKPDQQQSSTGQSASSQPSASPPPAQHHNRYNYASPDCSARIHSSSPQTQHASSLLHKSRDRYMLTPCKAKEHWVVVELCDEIRIEAVEVAIWEFFSGVVREVRISVGGEDDEEFEDDPADDVTGRSVKWKEVGSFVGKNVRGVQTFTLSQPTSFHRFIRLDFPSFYGTEYYCPVSQLKVYGMNQMEAFKWEQKRLSAVSKGKNEAKEKEAEERRAKEREEKEKKERVEKVKQQEREKELDALEKLLHEQAGRVVPDILSETAILSKLEETKVTKTNGLTSETKAATNTTSETPATSQTTARVSTESSPSSTSLSSPSSSSSSTYTRNAPPRSDSSESIYAFIIRRLNDLEGNSTLVARYIEEQAKVMRHMLTRVEKGWDEWKGDWEGEDRGRWEQERMRQEDRLGKVISQLEQQRSAFEEERKTLQSQMRGLAEELGYERRRGLAQLFVMFIIIILGVISRSSTINTVLKPLLAEAKRRRSIYGSKSFSGPLTGLRIDMGAGRPPAVIGEGRPKSLSDINDSQQDINSPTSPTPTPISSKTRLHGKSNSISRRPGTPNSSAMRQRRLPPGVITNFRSVSATEPHQLSSSPVHSGSGGYSNSTFSNLTSPKPRGSLSSAVARQNGQTGNARKLARSSHLHMIDSERRKTSKSPRPQSQITSPISPDGDAEGGEEGNFETPKRTRSRSSQVFHNGIILSYSPPINEVSPFTVNVSSKMPDQPSVGMEDGPSDWGTDVETEGSVSEVEDSVEVERGGRQNGSSDPVRSADDEEMVKELTDIWNNPSTNKV
uniref:SUN domain-containing protein n=1 Tax=Kwoniella bestiolae CBS 10118 TaxID=1296100 RepID=A0A1B9G342_9TREE|nr:hypothetical protein I302_05256 [Kwoniella bestiolae CBS 10118]OCF25436.1 hypothetical protein I302_05256 [Kwoniella bestiolae CBS 10118]